ncbi:ABC transporter permease subunit [Yinghuangia sp. ASG 101]|uniref:ABC transporter permease n=1 Tax=Yinghuangia sp. ASG 101 TaxID=2896848 RepID=UPI001E2C39F2|nr:ABC transporter permease subunit [Yinghuangia sp. ASG 101]UGQ12395.1 ABC transporter permease subunit [Yinghuangia sp. ASG 101]
MTAKTRTAARYVLFAVVAAMAVLVVAGARLAPHGQAEQLGLPFEGPTASRPFGTDVLGRDVLSRLLHGARATLLPALAATAAVTVVGGGLGLWAGLRGGRGAEAAVRVVDVLAAVPPLLLMLVLAAGQPGSSTALVVAIALATLPLGVRVVRSAARGIAAAGYLETARARGDRPADLLRYDVLPNLAGQVLADACIRLVACVHLTATAGFLGLGPGAPHADWGRMVEENLPGAELSPTAFLAPTLALILFTVSVTLLADRLTTPSGKES